ncbi:hypothetical protein [Burkholderia dolosa]|uniref:hypothetical protein n=1 Tax=Burkholderia dolosa TaxID=152500 RepID=UPI0015921BC5|nr:hypothetical protein [Burkholderia dolosa]MBR8458795.1 hypothetical protein [Burkholderia dolosa]MBY4752211.1 hypothetical protein [Burkholderia dolosa]MDN7421248.1 hypothetical protein [Burkholderia dolosa]
MRETVADAGCMPAAAAVSGVRHKPRMRAFRLPNRPARRARQADNPASFASVARATPTPIMRVPFIDA